MKKWAGLFLCILVISSLAGCEARSRYKVLSFFIDGVPDPDKIAALSKNQEIGEEAVVVKDTNLGHGPFEARLCYACHDPNTNRLIMPVEKLCFNCHELNIKKKFTHGPVAAGGCRVCHEPHGSGRPYLLVSESKTFCFHCHNEARISSTDVHRGIDTLCTTCHDAHSADNRFFLK